MTCDQCGSVAPLTVVGDWGALCLICARRQLAADDARDGFEYLSASMFGFLSDTE